MKSSKIKLMVMTSLFAALTCVATMVIRVPSPMSGYVNLGDSVVLLSGWMLGPVFGGIAAGLGSMLADILSGYAQYAPGTLIIKGAMAAAASLIFAGKSDSGRHLFRRIISGAAAETIMIAGYFGYAGLLLGNGLAAAASIPGNAIQGVFGIVTAVILAEVITKSRAADGYLAGLREGRNQHGG